MSKRKGRMSFTDAMAMVPDDLPDGAYFALAHEYAGLDYGDGFDELAAERRPGPPAFKCSKKLRAKIEAFGTLQQHNEYHWTVRVTGKVIADWWPHKRKWRIGGKNSSGNENDFLKALGAIPIRASGTRPTGEPGASSPAAHASGPVGRDNTTEDKVA